MTLLEANTYKQLREKITAEKLKCKNPKVQKILYATVIDEISEVSDCIKDFEQILKNNPDSDLEINPIIAKGLYAELKRLQYHEDTTIGLYAIDRKPKKVSYKWIKKQCFRIKKTDNVPLFVS